MTSVEAMVEIGVEIAPDHPAFAGHFPGAPMLPGVVLAALVFEALVAAPALAQRLGGAAQIDQVKFLSPVGPGSSLRIALSAQGSGVAFEIWRAATRVAHGRLSAATIR